MMASKSFHALVMAAALLVGWPSMSLSAENTKGMGASSPYPSGLEVAYEWRYSCANGRNCAPSIVPDRAVQATSRSSPSIWGPSISVPKMSTAYFMSFQLWRFRALTALISRPE
jgi:hypothetical protein